MTSPVTPFLAHLVEQRQSLLPLPSFLISRDRCILRDDITSNALLTHLVEQRQSLLPLPSFLTNRDRCTVRYLNWFHTYLPHSLNYLQNEVYDP